MCYNVNICDMPYINYEKHKWRMSLKKAFTLAEVLITLGIIGVVAAMTLPTLIQNYQKQVYLNQLKKNYAIITQAVSMLKAEYDGIDPVQMPSCYKLWDHEKFLDVKKFAEAITKYLPADSVKEDSVRKMCFDDPAKYRITDMGGSNFAPTKMNDNWAYTWHFNNGACVSFVFNSAWDWTEESKHSFIIDVNGSDKNPNRIGRDIFFFVLKPNGALLPMGYWYSKDEFENAWGEGCRTDGRGAGQGCARRIMDAGWTFPKNYPWPK